MQHDPMSPSPGDEPVLERVPSAGPPPAPGPAGRPPARSARSCLFVAIVVIVALGGLLLLLPGLFTSVSVPPNTVLVLDLRQPLPERSQLDAFEQLLGGSTSDLVAVHSALERAATDARVSGLLLRVGFPGVGPGRVQDLRELTAEFRRSGKFAIALLESGDTYGYWLATAADEIWMDRTSTLFLTGMQLQAYFLGDAFASFGLKADMVRVGTYKGAYEQLVNAAGSAAFREAMQATIDSLFDAMITDVASARQRTAEELRALIDRGPHSADAALETRLVDRLVYGDELHDLVESRCGGTPALLDIATYLTATSSSGSEAIALVHVDGVIVDRAADGYSPFGGMAGADVVGRALRDAREDSDIKAVVVRVSSQGGSLSASESMWREIELTRQSKPVVVSMGDVAASGGYYISTAASSVVAQPGTLTGSIGIFGGKFVAGDLLERFGVGIETYSRGARAGLFDMHREFSDDERAAMQEMLREGYDQFVARVATGRGWDPERVAAVAEGRVWTGAQAKERGLVDELGGLGTSIDKAAELAGLPPGASRAVALFPRAKGLLELLVEPPDDPRSLRARLAAAAGGAPRGMDAALALELADALRRLGILDGRHAMALAPWSLVR